MIDKEEEESHYLDSFGIVGEAWKIVHPETKLLEAIALTLMLPLSFVIYGNSLISEHFKKLQSISTIIENS